MLARINVIFLLYSNEAGDPAPLVVNCLRLMSVLGVSGEMALHAGDSLVLKVDQFLDAGHFC
jgi:hypothetical protein